MRQRALMVLGLAGALAGPAAASTAAQTVVVGTVTTSAPVAWSNASGSGIVWAGTCRGVNGPSTVCAARSTPGGVVARGLGRDKGVVAVGVAGAGEPGSVAWWSSRDHVGLAAVDGDGPRGIAPSPTGQRWPAPVGRRGVWVGRSGPSIVAVGFGANATVALRWNGGVWSQSPAPPDTDASAFAGGADVAGLSLLARRASGVAPAPALFRLSAGAWLPVSVGGVPRGATLGVSPALPAPGTDVAVARTAAGAYLVRATASGLRGTRVPPLATSALSLPGRRVLVLVSGRASQARVIGANDRLVATSRLRGHVFAVSAGRVGAHTWIAASQFVQRRIDVYRLQGSSARPAAAVSTSACRRATTRVVAVIGQRQPTVVWTCGRTLLATALTGAR